MSWAETRTGVGDYPELVGKLKQLGDGYHRVGRWGGWLEVRRSDGPTIRVWWTSDRDTHHPLRGPAITFDIDTETGRTFDFMHSIINMHWTRDPEERATHFATMVRYVDRAIESRPKERPQRKARGLLKLSAWVRKRFFPPCEDGIQAPGR